MVTPAPGGPPLLSRDTGRELARTELAHPIYHQGSSLTERVISAVSSLLSRIFAHVNSAVPGGWWALVVLAALAVLALGAVLSRIGPVARGHRRTAPVPGCVTTARSHRQRAEELAAAGDWTGAIRERLHALARDLEDRAILPPRAGRTAGELAAEAGSALPGYASHLRSSARLFDDVYYGARPGTPQGYAQVRDLDEGIRAARPVPLDARGMP